MEKFGKTRKVKNRPKSGKSDSSRGEKMGYVFQER